MIVFDERDALNGLRQAVSGKGASYVYEWTHCTYTNEIDGDLEPRCMVGYALACLGVPLRLVAELGNGLNIGDLAQRLRDHGSYCFTDRAVEILDVAQRIQDGAAFIWISKTPDGEIFTTLMSGTPRTWGTALDAAQRSAKTVASTTEVWWYDSSCLSSGEIIDAQSIEITETVEQIVAFTQQQQLALTVK